jgi:LysM repeat protein
MTYVVVAGDTVGAIARRTSTTVVAIVAANGLDSRAMIRIGQVLQIPSPVGSVAVVAAGGTTAGSYRVVAGDTVSGIAARYGTTSAAIVSANGLDSRALIRIGQTLAIPGTAGAPTPSAAPAGPAAPATASSYRVVAGDTVSGIAARYGTTSAAIISANGLDSRALIHIGQTLTIPGTAGTPTTTQSLVPNTFAGRTYPETTVAAASTNRATLLAREVPSRSQMQEIVRSTARSMGVDPALALAVAYQESGFNQQAVSPANAIGTMQVIPSSGVWASQLVGRPLDLLNPNDNAVAGVAILRQLVKSAPDLPTAIAGYYQGASSVRRNGMFDDTRRYVASVQTLMTRFA